MDKLPKGNQKITIKINGEEKEYKEDLVIHNWQDSSNEIAAASDEKLEENNINWSHTAPFKNTFKKKPVKKNLFRMKPAKGSNSGSIFLATILSAIGIGVLIGIVLLNVMVKDTGADRENDRETAESTPAAAEQMVLPGKTLYFLQQGVYQNEEAVIDLVEDLNSQNQPADYIKVNENLHVLVAVTNDLNAGKEMAAKEDYQNLWPKEITVEDKIIQNLTSDEKQFLESALSFYDILVKEGTESYLLGKESAANIEDLNTEYEKMLAFENFERNEIQDLYKSLLSAYEQLKLFIEEQDKDAWFAAQNHLLDFATEYISM